MAWTRRRRLELIEVVAGGMVEGGMVEGGMETSEGREEYEMDIQSKTLLLSIRR